MLTTKEETALVKKLQICAGYPLEMYDLRVIVKSYLDRIGRKIRKSKDNLPGPDFVKGFMSRHKAELAVRVCQNIKRSRAAVSSEIINNYFDKLERTIVGIPPSNIVNYDEMNLCNGPGRIKVVVKR